MFFAVDAPLQRGLQAGILHPAHHKQSCRIQENILRPTRSALINVFTTVIYSGEDDNEEYNEEEENCKQFFSFFLQGRRTRGFSTLAMHCANDFLERALHF